MEMHVVQMGSGSSYEDLLAIVQLQTRDWLLSLFLVLAHVLGADMRARFLAHLLGSL